MKRRKISKMGKRFIIRKLVIYIISLVMMGISLWKGLGWACEMNRSRAGVFWLVVLLFAAMVFVYFCEETFLDYKKRTKKR